MNVSNKTLAMFLVAAIVVSIFGTIFSLNTLDRLQTPTGFATTGSGNVTLTVGSLLSITTTDDNSIDFGTCTPSGGTDATINSETSDGGGSPNDICSGFSPDEILVRNDGNVQANVTINVSDQGDVHGGTFLNTGRDVSWISYKITNASSHGTYEGGCLGTFQSAYTNITNVSNSSLLGCHRLDFDSVYNSFELDVQILVPYDFSGGADNVTFTFIAANTV